MPDVKQRVGAYEAMLAKRNGNGASKTKDPLSVPHQAKHALDAPGDARDSYIPGLSFYDGEEGGSSKPSTPIEDALVDPLETAPPPVEKGKALSSGDLMNEAMRGVDPVVRIRTAHPDVRISATDLHGFASQMQTAIPILAAIPGQSQMIGPMMGQVAKVMSVAARFTGLEVEEKHAGLVGKTKVGLLRTRQRLLAELRGAVAPLAAMMAAAPQSVDAKRLMSWINSRLSKVMEEQITAMIEATMAKDGSIQDK